MPQFMALRQARPAPFEGEHSPAYAMVNSADYHAGPANYSSARAALQQGVESLPVYEAPRSPPLSPTTFNNIPGPSIRPASSHRITAHFPSPATHNSSIGTGHAQAPSRPSSSETRSVKPHSTPASRTGPTPARTSKPYSERSSKNEASSVPASKGHSRAASSSEAAPRRASYPSSSGDVIDLTSDSPEAKALAGRTRMPYSSSNAQSPPHNLPSGSSNEQQGATSNVAGTKRRLGMGRTAGGYANKKFKTPAFAPST